MQTLEMEKKRRIQHSGGRAEGEPPTSLVCVSAPQCRAWPKMARGARSQGPWRGADPPCPRKAGQATSARKILQGAGATTLSPGYSSKFSKMSLNKDLVSVWGESLIALVLKGLILLSHFP